MEESKDTSEGKKELVKTLTFGLGSVRGLSGTGSQVELFEPDDATRKKLYESLIDASRSVAQVMNVMISRMYASKILGVDPKQVESFSPNSKAIVSRLKGADSLSSYVSDDAAQVAKAHFAGEHGRELIVKGTRALSTHRTDGTHPIGVRARGAILLKRDDHYYLCAGVFGREWAETNKLPNWVAFPIHSKKRDKVLFGQLDRVVDGDWSLKNIRIQRRERGQTKWMGQIVVGYTVAPNPEIKENTILGIDRGVKNPLTIHVRSNGVPEKWERRIGRGQSMLQQKFLIRRQIVELLRTLRSKTSTLPPHMRETAQDRLRELRRRERNWVKTASRRLAAEVGEIARRSGAGTWQLEDLGKGIKEDTWLARNWPTAVLLDAIKWQAQQRGAQVVLVNPRYTSQRCSECGHIARANRPKGEKGASFFKCVACRVERDADKNAARNLSTPGIEEIIAKAKPADESPD